MRKKLILSFIIPITILLVTFLIVGIYPFGDKTIIVIDSNTQYVSFITYLRTILMGTNDFKYTFSTTLGSNFIPLFGYYLASPFNLITLLFKPENMKFALTLIILIKIGLSSLFMEYYLQKKYPNKNTLLFSLCYSLMSYNIVYMYHVMWLDSVMLFPIVILGIDYIFNNKSPALYIISLAISIIFNYYIGIIVCLGSLIYFVYKCIYENNNINKVKTFINYSISSLLAGMASMFILIPSFFGIIKGKANFSLSNLNFGITTSYLKIIAKTFTASLGEGETWNGGPMIACGMIIVVLLILYFINKKISKRNKIINGIFIIFLLSTFAIGALDLLFHGLNTPNCFDYRHAFIVVFFLITIATDSYMNLTKDKKDLKLTLLITFIVSVIIYFAKYKFNQSTYGLTILLSFIITFLILFILYKNKKPYKFLLIITIIDLLINSTAGVLMITLSDKQSINNYQNYVESTNKIIDNLKEYDNTFYRVEKTYDRETNENMLSINDSMIFNYNGISHFDSTSRSDVEIFLEKLGFRRLLTRSYYNKNGSTTVADMLLGVKYVVSYEQYKNYKEIIKNDNLKIYQNPYYLSLGYTIDDFDITLEKDPFLNMNNIVKEFTNVSKDIYEIEDYKENKFIDSEEKYVYTYEIEVSSNDELYFYFDTPDEIQTKYMNALMYVNDVYIDKYFSKYNWGVMSLGNYNIGDKVELKFVFDKDIIINNPYFYYENMDILEEQYDVLKENTVNLEMITSSHLKSNINLNSSKDVILSIPYDEGWHIKVNDKEIKQYKILDVLTGIKLKEGINEIDLTYTPKGLKEGLIISSVSIVGIIIYLLLRNKYTKKKS